MKVFLRLNKDISASRWAGGETRELFIFPASASYAKRDFSLRISSATIEDSPSTFTFLPSFQRALMPISNTIKLSFNDQPSLDILPFHSVHFEGATKTVSHNAATDFGVMFSNDLSVSILSPALDSFVLGELFTAIYSLADNLCVSLNNIAYPLNKGDFLLFDNSDSIQNGCNSPSKQSSSKGDLLFDSSDSTCCSQSASISLPHKNAAIIARVSRK